jgi:hypothetical protein
MKIILTITTAEQYAAVKTGLDDYKQELVASASNVPGSLRPFYEAMVEATDQMLAMLDDPNNKER